MSKNPFVSLLPCPFCGGEATLSSNNMMIQGESEMCAWVYCKKCHARTNYKRRSRREHYVHDAIVAWNARCEK